MVFLKKKILPPKKFKKYFFLPFFSATFQCADATMFSIFFFFLPMKNWKNHPKKLLRIGPDPFFPLTSPGHSPGHSPRPKIDFPYHEISGPDICSLICGSDFCYNFMTLFGNVFIITQTRTSKLCPKMMIFFFFLNN